MPIENNLPTFLDNATHTEDGLMSKEDKIKLDSINVEELLGTIADLKARIDALTLEN